MKYHSLKGGAGRLDLSTQLSGDKLELVMDGLEGEATILAREGSELVLEVDGRQLRAAFRLTRDAVELMVEGKRHLFQRVAPDAPEESSGGVGDIEAPMTGKVVDVACAVGDEVEAGASLVILEAMKMEHRLKAPDRARVVEISVEPGQQVDIGDLLVRLEALEEDCE